MPNEPATRGFILTLDCASGPGQVAATSSFLDAHGCYIDELAVFDDDISSRFFVRCVFHRPPRSLALAAPRGGASAASERPGAADGPLSLDALRQAFAPVAQRFAMSWSMHDRAERPRVLLMVSKFDHCLRDLLYRWHIGELAMDVPAVVSNHLDLKPIARENALPFHHLPVTPDTKAEQEARLMDIVSATGAEFVVLARYMQVLSADLCEKLAGRAVNIHHSFLPGFKGARPYHQAHERGVKLIGATAHFVTSDLDEGPIIEQVVERVDHAFRPEQLAATGRDMECAALARAVKYCIERRVFLNGKRTVVFR